VQIKKILATNTREERTSRTHVSAFHKLPHQLFSNVLVCAHKWLDSTLFSPFKSGCGGQTLPDRERFVLILILIQLLAEHVQPHKI
jgi:hypothetical protein